MSELLGLAVVLQALLRPHNCNGCAALAKLCAALAKLCAALAKLCVCMLKHGRHGRGSSVLCPCVIASAGGCSLAQNHQGCQCNTAPSYKGMRGCKSQTKALVHSLVKGEVLWQLLTPAVERVGLSVEEQPKVVHLKVLQVGE